MISREQLVTDSVITYAVARLQSRGYVRDDDYELSDRFPGSIAKLTKTIVAVGFNFDDEGEGAEMGSDLRRRTYTLEFWVFGTNAIIAQNLASFIKFDLERDGVPLLDENDAELDTLEVDGVSSQREELANPEPWQEYVWTTVAKVSDEYFASLV